jgi:TATA-box binding protein (TBP) (component of TFIID and TFIIIB)
MSVVQGSALEQLAIQPTVNNIKIRLTVCRFALPRLKENIGRLDAASGANLGRDRKRIFKRHHNFIVFRNDFVFIIFFSSGTVNITGIKGFSHITSALQTFCTVFNIKRRHLQDLTVDNVSANGQFSQLLDLAQLKQVINEREEKGDKLISSVSYNTNYFPAAFCKTFSIGTILVFNSGRFNIVGAKCQSHIREIYTEMLGIVNSLASTSRR